MTETGETTEIVVEKLPLKHQFGKLMVGSIAAFTANQMAEKAYDAALRAYRARKA
jgi:hypothetical protein